MHQIDTATAAPAMPAADASVAPGYFTEGSPGTATAPTIVSAYWLNAVQSELLAVVAAGGIAPARAALTQVRDAISAMISAAIGVFSTRKVLTGGLATGGGDLTADRTITVAKASAADVLAGIDDAKAVTAAALAGNMSLALTGYYKHPGGFIEQWGRIATPAGSEHAMALAFPIAFPNACCGINFTTINSASSNNGDVTYQEVSLTTAGATIFVQSDSNDLADGAGGFRWRAWGY